MELWAVIATAWGWPPSEMDRMTVPELVGWAELARQVLQAGAVSPR